MSASVEAIVRQLKPRARSRVPKGWRLEFRVSRDDLTDAYRIAGFTHRSDAIGAALGASYREASVVTRDIRFFRNSDRELVDEVVRCMDLVTTYLFQSRPAFRIGTKPSAKRLVMEMKR